MLNENIDLGDTGRATSMKRRAKKKKLKTPSLGTRGREERFPFFSISPSVPAGRPSSGSPAWACSSVQCHSGKNQKTCLDNYLNGLLQTLTPSISYLYRFFFFFFQHCVLKLFDASKYMGKKKPGFLLPPEKKRKKRQALRGRAGQAKQSKQTTEFRPFFPPFSHA